MTVIPVAGARERKVWIFCGRICPVADQSVHPNLVGRIVSGQPVWIKVANYCRRVVFVICIAKVDRGGIFRKDTILVYCWLT